MKESGKRVVDLNRMIKFWKYSVTHAQVVLLGQKDEANPTRVVFLLKVTHEICIPTYFFCKQVTWEEGSEIKDVVFSAEDGEHRIRCEFVWFDEDELEFDDESPLIDTSLFS